MGRILCVSSPSWPIASWRRRNPSAESLEAPLALIAAVRGVRRLAAVCEQGTALGLRAGQKATDALVLAPDLVMVDAEPEADAAALEALCDWCVRFSPAVAIDPPDGLFLEIDGVAHLWGGERPMLDDLMARLAANGIPARGAIADTPGAAWALAHHGRDRTIAPRRGQKPLLALLPPAALRLPDEDARQLPRLGLTTIGQLYPLPRPQLARRFGKDLLLRLDQALGLAEEALAFRRPASPWFERLAFAEPISAPEDLARAMGDILGRLCARLERRGQGAKRFELAFHRLDGETRPLSIGLALAGREPRPIARLFAPKIETVDPGFGIEVVTLEAFEVEAMEARQGRLDSGVSERADLAPLVDRLANRLGEARVWRAAAVESHVPEGSVARRPAMAPARADWDPVRPRPIRLFRRPEPIEAMAPIPDDPPVHFRWRGQLHRVTRAEGPERIAEEWWRGPIDDVNVSHVRDYYRVEDEAGARFWLFRAGLYDGETVPRWWLHGLFG